MKGSQILVEGVEHHELKLLLHKFLYHRGLDGYKVHSRPDILEIVPPDGKEDQKPSEGRPPTAPETMPYFFPGRQYPGLSRTEQELDRRVVFGLCNYHSSTALAMLLITVT